ncbi:U3 small nucleolar ribonucleoprotein protein IMP3 [Parasteatoda tepidariorum]|uniref:U3 small nucleolar ribonucleoprotein protein IMP3 n=1 Tax=Parasteatoda tepidariorum TaxID=114398 RepID=UPI00077F8A1E|nr:U3 small nucleolar ribonucleoprotein protein IMP3 [Parasteatoda tepidariorum]
MVRKLKYHEQKLLKKVDFISWEVDNTIHELKIMKKYFVQKREDYTRYNQLSRKIRTLGRAIKELDMKDPYRKESGNRLLQQLYSMGLIGKNEGLELCDKVTASSFCRRRLPVLMVRSKMAPSLKISHKFIEQGHVRIGPNVVMDPSFLVTRNMEDFITWVDRSAIKKHIARYNEELDDFDLM